MEENTYSNCEREGSDVVKAKGDGASSVAANITRVCNSTRVDGDGNTEDGDGTDEACGTSLSFLQGSTASRCGKCDGSDEKSGEVELHLQNSK